MLKNKKRRRKGVVILEKMRSRSKVVDTDAGRICSVKSHCTGEPQPLENFEKTLSGHAAQCNTCKYGKRKDKKSADATFF